MTFQIKSAQNTNTAAPVAASAAAAAAGNVAAFDRNARSSSTTTNAKGEVKELTQVWLNPVYLMPNPEADEGFDRVSLPYGLAVDTMNFLPEKGSAEFIESTVQPRNEFLSQMREFGLRLEPGETRLLTPVEIDPENPAPVLALEIRRIKERDIKPSAKNTLVNAIRMSFGA